LAVKGRKTTPSFPAKKGKRALVHCASLGEYEQAKPIIEKCKSEGIEVVVSFFSPSGFEQKKDDPSLDYVTYLPFDLKSKIIPFLKSLDPDFLIFVKYEFWWNTIRSAYPIYFISVVLRPDHYLFKSWAMPFLNTLKNTKQIFLIDKPSFQLLEAQGFKNIQLTGDTRVEGVLKRKELGIKDEVIEKFCGKSKVMVFGSTYHTEHQEIIRVYDELQENFKLLIFPHEIDHKEIFTLKEALGKDTMIYSQWLDKPIFNGYNTLIVDKVGLLKDAYRYGDLAYIGGGFTHGLHNILEPFVYKLPLIFGPQYERFPEAKLLADKTFVKVITNVHDLGSAVKQLQNEDLLEEINEVYMQIFDSSEMASALIMQQLRKEQWKLNE
jgi:3-deoxy-D-manno-octulosonic-acid transferase